MEEITISSNNAMEEFVYTLSSAPSWLQLLSIEEGRVLIGGEVPVGSNGIYEINFNVEGIRSGLTSMSFEMEVLSLDHANIELFGNQVEMISAAQVYEESGFTGTDLKTMEDISNMVTVSTGEKDSYGINKFYYTLEDEISWTTFQTRLVREYGNSPLTVSNVSVVEASSIKGIDWSDHEYLLTWGDEIQSIYIEKVDSNLTFINEQSSLVVFSQDSPTAEKLGSVVNDDNASFHVIRDFGEFGTLVLGTFSGDIEVFGKKILSDNRQNIFICLLDKDRNLAWIKAFGGEVNFSDLNLLISPDKNIFVVGSYLGDFEIQSLNKGFRADEKRHFYFSISEGGEFMESFEINVANGATLQGVESSLTAFI